MHHIFITIIFIPLYQKTIYSYRALVCLDQVVDSWWYKLERLAILFIFVVFGRSWQNRGNWISI